MKTIKFENLTKNLKTNQVLHYNQLLSEIWKSGIKIKNKTNFINEIKMILNLPYKETIEIYKTNWDFDKKELTEIKIGEIDAITYNEFNMLKILEIRKIG